MNGSILITGGSGLLALNWALAVRDTKDVILALHDRKIKLSGTRTYSLSLESPDEIADELLVLKPSLVIHAAGLTSVEVCEERPNFAEHINIDLAGNLAKVCANLKLPFVHISTDHLFSGDAVNSDENCPIAPLNVYAQTKALAECIVLKEHPKALVIRTNFYGWGTSYRQSFSDLIIQSLRAGREIELFDDVFYTPILVESLAHAVHDLVGLGRCGIFNLVGDERISKKDFGLLIAHEFNLNSNLIKTTQVTRQSNLVRRPLDMSLSNRKAVSVLGRGLGGIQGQVARLHEQELSGVSIELGKL